MIYLYHMNTASTIYYFDIISREHSSWAVRSLSRPPARVNLFDMGNDIIWVKGYLSVISCNHKIEFYTDPEHFKCIY